MAEFNRKFNELQLFPERYKETVANLIDVRESTTVHNLDAIERLINDVSIGSIGAWNISTDDVFYIGKTDMLVRMQRNMNSCVMLLRMAKDAMECAKEEEYAIYDALVAFVGAQEERKQFTIERRKASETSREKYDRKKAKEEREPAE